MVWYGLVCKPTGATQNMMGLERPRQAKVCKRCVKRCEESKSLLNRICPRHFADWAAGRIGLGIHTANMQSQNERTVWSMESGVWSIQNLGMIMRNGHQSNAETQPRIDNFLKEAAT
ncbi:hypothetical protein ONS95_010944 [Cadophora gregata]|uniref:uncharacterized protein n=1 Tax=Cadophora gregata TaxID=51156 RepID=UPI0026DCBCE6|nr:uncharacterized protein ONS95_010944 [Cadophora gregata]KAK0119498.1 hypothetical protein ONS95_010944 [Cadophora gregata]